MLDTRLNFRHENLLTLVKQSFVSSCSRLKLRDKANNISNLDCLMSGLAIFSLKFPSLLQWDIACKADPVINHNISSLYGVKNIPCDTYLRERLDVVHYDVTRLAFTKIFSHLQRGNILNEFRFLDKYYLVSIDGTGYFSSHEIFCENCCVKESKTTGKTYYHQMLSGALVHPGQKVVFPFAPEPIMKADGAEKNDCERNAAKRWLEKFRREHPHLPVVIVADGLSSNTPFIKLLQEYNMNYILVARESDHKYLSDWIKQAEPCDAPSLVTEKQGIIHKYQWMNDVPLNASSDINVSVLRFSEQKRKHKKKSNEESITSWMWVTNFSLNKQNVPLIAKGGRARWKIENETFNTLKNNGYNFEHNYGHGNKYLNTLFAHLMLLAFFIDQVIQILDKKFIAAWQKLKSKIALWETVRGYVRHYYITSFEALYTDIAAPPEQRITRHTL